MSIVIADVLMNVALASLPPHQRVWAAAMRVEYGEATADGRSLSFAIGCLFGNCRLLPTHHDGQFLLARWGLALGGLIPFATFHLGCSLSGLRLAVAGRDHFSDAMGAGTLAQKAAAAAYVAAAPLYTILLVALGAFHMAAAWYLLIWQTRPLMRSVAGAAIAALLLLACVVVTLGQPAGLAILLGALAFEATCLPILIYWHRSRWLPGSNERTLCD